MFSLLPNMEGNQGLFVDNPELLKVFSNLDATFSAFGRYPRIGHEERCRGSHTLDRDMTSLYRPVLDKLPVSQDVYGVIENQQKEVEQFKNELFDEVTRNNSIITENESLIEGLANEYGLAVVTNDAARQQEINSQSTECRENINHAKIKKQFSEKVLPVIEEKLKVINLMRLRVEYQLRADSAGEANKELAALRKKHAEIEAQRSKELNVGQYLSGEGGHLKSWDYGG